jgi:hypothetical protein
MTSRLGCVSLGLSQYEAAFRESEIDTSLVVMRLLRARLLMARDYTGRRLKAWLALLAIPGMKESMLRQLGTDFRRAEIDRAVEAFGLDIAGQEHKLAAGQKGWPDIIRAALAKLG